MTGSLQFMPSLGGATSSGLIVKRLSRLAAQSRTFIFQPINYASPPQGVTLVDDMKRILDGGPRDRLAELREAAARRTRDMPVYDDPADEIKERAELVAAFEELQTSTTAWNTGD